jgi:hypothetical protein
MYARTVTSILDEYAVPAPVGVQVKQPVENPPVKHFDAHVNDGGFLAALSVASRHVGELVNSGSVSMQSVPPV